MSRAQTQPISSVRRRLYRPIALAYSMMIVAGPLALEGVAAHALSLSALWMLVFGPIIYVVLFPCIAGFLSIAHRGSIIPGRFPTDVGHPTYFHRRLYGLCWTLVYYSGPIYAIVLGWPWLRSFVLWLFGYRGAASAVFYPDTWIRDLPLLELGDGAYLSNKATLGTNVILMNREILVQRIRIGDRSLVGHLVIVGTGVQIGHNVEIGLATSLGVGTTVEDGARVGPCCGIEHRVRIGRGARVGARSYVGSRAVIGADVHIPADTRIASGTRIMSSSDLDRLNSSRDSMKAEVEPRWDNFVDGLSPEAGGDASTR